MRSQGGGSRETGSPLSHVWGRVRSQADEGDEDRATHGGGQGMAGDESESEGGQASGRDRGRLPPISPASHFSLLAQAGG